MNIYVPFSLWLFFLAPGGCPMYSVDLSTLEVPNDFQNELTLQSMLNSELHQYRNKLYENAKINVRSALTYPFLMGGSDKDKMFYWDPQDEASQQTPKVSRSTNNESDRFLGTNLFGDYTRKCFSTEDIALMSARKDFESLIPKAYPKCLIGDSVVYMLMKYFNTINQIVKGKADAETRRLLQRAYYDALGGYLRFYLLPVAQLSYYAGRLKLCTVERLVALYRQCRVVLNTNGNGWRTPSADILGQLVKTPISPISIEDCKNSESDAASCTLLDQSYVTKEADIVDQMIVTLPHLEPLDNNGFMGNIFIPFRQRRIYNLQSPNSAFILVKFFKIVTNCHRFQGLSQRTYNLKLGNWIRDNLEVHYKDDVFYPGLGGILQVSESLGGPKKATNTSKKEDQEPQMSKEDSKDYQMSLEDMNTEGEKCAPKKVTESRKQSRSPKQSKKHIKSDYLGDGQKLFLAKANINTDNDDCIECDDEMYVAYVAAFLAILLLILLLLICLCMRRAASRERKHRRRPKPAPSEEEQQPPSTPPSIKPPKQGCWNSLFHSKKNKNKENPRKRQPKGMGFQDDYYSRSLGFTDSTSHKTTDRTETDAEGSELLSSTSSLGCQFPRKCLPIKLTREKRDEYYTTSEREPSNARSKKRDKQRQRTEENSKQKNRFIATPYGISEEQSSPRRQTPSPKKLEDASAEYKAKRSTKNPSTSGEESESKKQRHLDNAKTQAEKENLRKECEEYKKTKRKEELAKINELKIS
ncbi:uncharacterized protein LOC6649835 isoform X2 [Drosophila willistoni]|uniref:uncharacterized protein LOC6649835 isoform X2 n=1 Tax=Drosophila willistoni TaxID=7260 RepID=UPI000C26D6F6|nr:uncharacterized protein LOC6649835 isoform X2 [Drosophila willistoni]